MLCSHSIQPSAAEDAWEAHAVSPTRATASRTGWATFAIRATRAGQEANVQLVCFAQCLICSSLTAICASGCEAGTCARPGDCVCNRGYHGPLCTSTHNVSVANSGIDKCDFADASSECILGLLASSFHVLPFRNRQPHSLPSWICLHEVRQVPCHWIFPRSLRPLLL
jgi:hypothetical protein